MFFLFLKSGINFSQKGDYKKKIYAFVIFFKHASVNLPMRNAHLDFIEAFL